MESQITPALMTAPEARRCIEKIKEDEINMRGLLYDLYIREGWKALEYKSWRACVTAEFQKQERYLYKQLEAAKVEMNICPNGQIGEIPESQTRPLSGLPPEQQQEVWNKANETAPEGKVTAAHVQTVVDQREYSSEDADVPRTTHIESENLYRLKSLWGRSNKMDKKHFLSWVKKEGNL